MIFLLFLLENCFVAKRSPYDTATPSGATINMVAALSKIKFNSTNEPNLLQPIVVNAPIKLVAKGQELVYQFPGAENFANFSIAPNSPPLPPQVTLGLDGTLPCSCPNNTPFQGNTYTMTYTAKNDPSLSFTTTFKLFVYSPNALVVISDGISSAEDLAPIVYNNKVYLFYRDNSNNIKLKQWNGKHASDWQDLSFNVASYYIQDYKTLRAIVYKNSVYIGFKGNSNYYVYSFDGTNSNSVDISSMSCGTCFDSAMEVFNDELYVSYVDSNLNLYKSTGGSFNSNFTSITLNGSSNYTSLHAWNRKLWMAYTNNDTSSKSVNLANSGNNWNPHYQVVSNSIYSYTALASFQNKLYILWTETIAPQAIYFRSTTDGSFFQPENGGNNLSEGTGQVGGVSMLTFNNKLYIAYAQGSVVKYRSFDGKSWSSPSPDLAFNPSSTHAPRFFVWEEILILGWVESSSGAKKIFIKVLE